MEGVQQDRNLLVNLLSSSRSRSGGSDVHVSWDSINIIFIGDKAEAPIGLETFSDQTP